MKIQNNYTQTNFGQLYIASIEAEKLLKKADRVIKANPNVTYINTNIPEGHSKPLWSVFSQAIKERQAQNPNNIIIELADKAKQLLSVKLLMKKGLRKVHILYHQFQSLGHIMRCFQLMICTEITTTALIPNVTEAVNY